MSEDQNVVHLKHPGPSVGTVITDLLEHEEDLRTIVIVGIRHDGEITVWASGRREEICSAAIAIDQYAKAHLNGAIKDEVDNPGPKS